MCRNSMLSMFQRSETGQRIYPFMWFQTRQINEQLGQSYYYYNVFIKCIDCILLVLRVSVHCEQMGHLVVTVISLVRILRKV